MENFRTELEKCVIKANWQKRGDLRKHEEQNKKNENDETEEISKELVDNKAKTVDFRNLRATDLKNNKRIIIPNLDNEDEEEIRRNNVKKELEGVFIHYMKENCDKFGNMKENNLTKKQVGAIKSLKDKMEEENLVCFETDKTGKFALDTKDNYVRKMKKHIVNDKSINMREVRKIEKEMNDHADNLVSIVNAGSNTGQTKRIKSNLKTIDNQIPILSGTHKDHKKVDNTVEGPDLRPIMGATVGPNVALTNFIGKDIVKKIAEDASGGHDIKSNEELLSRFVEYNKSRVEGNYDSKKVFIASMDIDKWFPSMKNRAMAMEIRQMIIDSEIEFKEVDYDKVSKYLGKYMTVDEIIEEEMEDLLYIDEEKMNRIKEIKIKEKEEMRQLDSGDVTFASDDVQRKKAHKKRGKNMKKKEEFDSGDVTIASNNVQGENAHKKRGKNMNKKYESEKLDSGDVTIASNDVQGEKTHKKRGENLQNGEELKQIDSGDVSIASDDVHENEAHKKRGKIVHPNDIQKRRMLSKTVEIMIIAGMENHVYRFGNEIKKQMAGGPIGLSLTGEVADCYLIGWDKKFLKRLEELGINIIIYERFKDDITIVAEALERGSKLMGDKIIKDEEKKKLDSLKEDEEISMEIIQEVAESIDDIVKFTVDLPSKHENGKIAILDIEAKINKDEGNRIEYEFYEKPSKNKRVILENSALPFKQKRTILTQECLRRLRNTMVDLGEETRNKHLDNYMLKLKNSGYSIKFRTDILDSALNAFEKIMKDDKEGIKPLFRDREWNKEERAKDKKNKKLNWYNGGSKNEIEYKTVLFVPVTKGGKLVKELKQREEEINRFSKERIKIVEGGGVQMKDFMVKKNPFPSTKCEKKKCIICESNVDGKVQIPCNSNNVGYQLVCDTCRDRGEQKVYEGETSRSARVRGAEHLSNFRSDRVDSALYKHKHNEHAHEDMKFSMHITKRFRDPLSRQANEAVRISGRKRGELLNSKNEFNHPPIARISVERNKKWKNNTRNIQPGQ